MKITSRVTLETLKNSYIITEEGFNMTSKEFSYVSAQDCLTSEKFTLKYILSAGDKGADEKAKLNFFKEGLLMKQLNNPNIARCFEYGRGIIESPKGKLIVYYLLLESLPTRSLADIVMNSQSSTDFAKKTTKRLAETIEFLHTRSLGYGDLNLKNVLVTDDQENIKLYNFSKVKANQEIEKKDVYDLGFILFELHTYRLPFEEEANGTWRRTFYSPYRLYYWKGVAQQSPCISISFINIINKMLEADPNKRSSAGKLLKDSFFEDIDNK